MSSGFQTNRENPFLNQRVLPKKYGTSIHLKISFLIYKNLKTNCIIIIMRIHLFGVKCNLHTGLTIFVADVDLETQRQLSFHLKQKCK